MTRVEDTTQNVWGAAHKRIYKYRSSVRRNNGELMHDGSANTIILTLGAGNYTAKVAVDSSDFTISIGPQQVWRGITPLALAIRQKPVSDDALSSLARSSSRTRCDTGLTRRASSRRGSPQDDQKNNYRIRMEETLKSLDFVQFDSAETASTQKPASTNYLVYSRFTTQEYLNFWC